MGLQSIMNRAEKGIVFIISIIVIVTIIVHMNIHFKDEIYDLIHNDYIEGFTIIFLSIILEAIPFVIIGAFISSIIQIFISEQTIARIIPKNRIVGLVMASLMGIVFPVCECAIVPIVKRLIKKGVPVYIGITFMLSVPIVNLVVLASTFYAFNNRIYMVCLRGVLGLMSAILIGHLVGIVQGEKNPLKNEHHHEHDYNCGCGHEHHHHSCGCGHHKPIKINTRIHINHIFSKIMNTIEHTSSELYHVGKFLIVGAFLSAFMQTFISRSYIVSIGQGKVFSIIIMMSLAFILSLCSEADAFIARTFVGQFTTGSIVGFLIYGPMIDIKNTFMLSASFNMKFVIKLIMIISIVCFMMSIGINLARI